MLLLSGLPCCIQLFADLRHGFHYGHIATNVGVNVMSAVQSANGVELGLEVRPSKNNW